MVFLSVKGRRINQNFFERRFRKLADKAGFTQAHAEAIKEDLERLIILAKSKDIPLGAVQALISRLWRVAA
jgi:hypothetical protein